VAGIKRGAAAFVVAGLAGLAPAEGPASAVRFPGAATRAVDPTGRYAVECVGAEQAAQPVCHGLLLRELASGKTRPLRAFGAWATVLWAPSGRRVAVTDGVASARSEVWVYRADEPSAPVDVSEVLEHQRKSGLAFAAGADHRYLETVRWAEETTLVVRLWGYGGPKPFDRQLDVKLGD